MRLRLTINPPHSTLLTYAQSTNLPEKTTQNLYQEPL
jgi:hypothetical protein